jgi:hypothetical protein
LHFKVANELKLLQIQVRTEATSSNNLFQFVSRLSSAKVFCSIASVFSSSIFALASCRKFPHMSDEKINLKNAFVLLVFVAYKLIDNDFSLSIKSSNISSCIVLISLHVFIAAASSQLDRLHPALCLLYRDLSVKHVFRIHRSPLHFTSFSVIEPERAVFRSAILLRG